MVVTREVVVVVTGEVMSYRDPFHVLALHRCHVGDFECSFHDESIPASAMGWYYAKVKVVERVENWARFGMNRLAHSKD